MCGIVGFTGRRQAAQVLLDGLAKLEYRGYDSAGILDVISFDENSIVLDTDMGLLTIKGKDLHVNRLSLEKGEIDIEGRTDSLVYSAGGGAKSGESFFAKLFK